MAEVSFKHGYVYKQTGPQGNQQNINTFRDALEELATGCLPCACSSCYGYTTLINAETGDVVMLWVTGTGTEGDPFVQNIDTYDNGLVAVKALKAART